MVIKALFHIIKNVLLDPALPLPNTVQREMPQFEEAERKKRCPVRGRPK